MRIPPPLDPFVDRHWYELAVCLQGRWFIAVSPSELAVAGGSGAQPQLHPSLLRKSGTTANASLRTGL